MELRTKKSKMSVLVIAAAMSFRCSVLRLFSSEWFHDLSVSSRMNISHACRTSSTLSTPNQNSHCTDEQTTEAAGALTFELFCKRQTSHLREEDWRLCTDHAHILVRLHDLQEQAFG